MRITFLTAIADMSGGARVIDIYARLLQARGHEVTLVTRPYPRPSLRKRFRSFLRGEGVLLRDHPSHYDNASYPLRVVDQRRRIEADDVPDGDVVVATWWETAEWMVRLPASKGRHVHFVQHYEAFADWIKPRVDSVLRLPTYKIVISSWLEDMMRQTFGNSQVTLIPNSVDLEQFRAPPRGRQARPTVGMLYSPIAWKDVPTGFRAVELVRRRYPDLRLVTFGTGAPTRELPLPPNTHHTVLPPQDALRDIYAACDAWICSSIAEGFGLPALEAMACRCPVVSTRVGGPIDFIEDGRNGFLVDVGDAEGLADRLDRLLLMPEASWRAISNAAHATAAAYNWDDAVARFEQALAEAAA